MFYFSLFYLIGKYKALIIGLAFIFIFVWLYANNEAKKITRMNEAREMHSVSVLPAGVEEIWLAYIKQRFSEEIQREGNSLRVRTNYIGAAPTYSYVSLNHPYEIDCNSFQTGISISFTSTDDESIGPILTGDFSLDRENEPEMGVPVGSIASDNLDAALCKYIAQLMEDIVSSKSRQ